MKRLTLSLLILCLGSPIMQAQNWPQFRGPSASGVVEGQTAAVTWNAEKSENLRWKTKLPGLAHSSPVVWGNKVFVTTAVTTAAKDETRYGLFGDVAPVKDDQNTSGRFMRWTSRRGGFFGNESLTKDCRRSSATPNPRTRIQPR